MNQIVEVYLYFSNLLIIYFYYSSIDKLTLEAEFFMAWLSIEQTPIQTAGVVSNHYKIAASPVFSSI